jgi:hypothetical protein
MVKSDADVSKKHVTSIFKFQMGLTSSWWGSAHCEQKIKISEMGCLQSVAHYGCELIYGHTPNPSSLSDLYPTLEGME